MKNEPRKFEESMSKLEKIVEELEQGEFSLEESLQKFEQGLKLGNDCKSILDKAEARVKRLVEKADGELTEEDTGDELF